MKNQNLIEIIVIVWCYYREAYTSLQSNIKSWCLVRTWPWFLLMGAVKPMIEKARADALAAKAAAEAASKASAGSEDQDRRIKVTITFFLTRSFKFVVTKYKMLQELEEALDKEKTERQRAELETLRITQEKAKLQQELEKETELRKSLEDKVKVCCTYIGALYNILFI